MTEIFEALSEAADEAVAELYPPRPGGLVHKHRQRVAAREAEVAEDENAAERIEQRAYKAVKVAPESPEIISAITYTIAAGGNALILSLNPYRYRAVINLLTASATVVLCKDQGAATGGVGYTISSTNPLLSVFSRAQLWAFNNTGSTIQVSVMTESYAPEGKK